MSKTKTIITGKIDVVKLVSEASREQMPVPVSQKHTNRWRKAKYDATGRKAKYKPRNDD